MSYLSDSNTQIVLTPEQETTLDSLTGLATTPAGDAIAKKADGTFENVAVHNGDVVSVAVATANGLAGTSDGNQSNPTLTLRTTVTGLLKGNGTAISSATVGTDYAPATSGTSILKGNGTGGFSNAVSSTDYAPATIGTSVLSGNGTGGFTNLLLSQTQADLSETNTSSLNYVKNQGALKVNGPQGFMLNGKIVTSVASGNLTVAIKTLAGTDPSAANPVHVRIGDTVRTISSALSMTNMTAGTNWFNAGSKVLATKEIDYFVYLFWSTTSSTVSLSMSRIPYATQASDFSSSTTNEKYGGGGLVPTGTDQCEVVGRINAILSAGAGYTWSIPATSIIINRPIFESRRLSFLPYLNTGIGETYTIQNGIYQIKGNTFTINMQLRFAGFGTTVATDVVTLIIPFSQTVSFENPQSGYAVTVGTNPATASLGLPTTFGNGCNFYNSYGVSYLTVAGVTTNTIFLVNGENSIA